MSESSDIPTGTYSLSLGRSFDTKSSRKNDPKAAQFHTLRYDFKPSSVSNNADNNTFIAFGANSQDVHVSVPSEGGDNMTVYKGSKKDAKPKECLLFFDKKTGTVRLEKITSNINVKKTRDLDPGTEQALKRGIERLRTTSSKHSRHQQQQRSPSSSPEVKQKPSTQQQDSSDSESDSDSDSDKSNAESSDDDEGALLEHMGQQQQQQKPREVPVAASSSSSSNSYHHRQEHVSSNYSNHYGSSSSHSANRNNATKNTKDSEKYGLALSESSDEDD